MFGENHGFDEKYQKMVLKVAQRLRKWSQNGHEIDQKSDRKNIKNSIRKKVAKKSPKGPTWVDGTDRPDPFGTPGRGRGGVNPSPKGSLEGGVGWKMEGAKPPVAQRAGGITSFWLHFGHQNASKRPSTNRCE